MYTVNYCEAETGDLQKCPNPTISTDTAYLSRIMVPEMFSLTGTTSLAQNYLINLRACGKPVGEPK